MTWKWLITFLIHLHNKERASGGFSAHRPHRPCSRAAARLGPPAATPASPPRPGTLRTCLPGDSDSLWRPGDRCFPPCTVLSLLAAPPQPRGVFTAFRNPGKDISEEKNNSTQVLSRPRGTPEIQEDLRDGISIFYEPPPDCTSSPHS